MIISHYNYLKSSAVQENSVFSAGVRKVQYSAGMCNGQYSAGICNGQYSVYSAGISKGTI